MTKWSTSKYFRFKWSHQSVLHRLLVQRANTLLRHVPFSIKYGLGVRARRDKPPYCLVPGKTVVQIGAPHDTLHSGRSRGMYFSLMAGSNGRVLIIEPDPVSVEAFRMALETNRIANTTVHWSGAWSEPREIELYVNRQHPATSFSNGTVHYDQERLKEYEPIRVPADSVDNIIAQHEMPHVDLVSITTNWAELEILRGMSQTISNGLTYICLAYGNPGTDYIELLDRLGYALLAHDDRGMTFKRKA